MAQIGDTSGLMVNDLFKKWKKNILCLYKSGHNSVADGFLVVLLNAK